MDKLPEGTEHRIAQMGRNVSGGQKQRLSIARALARKPEILVFDDSFSALDYRTDAKLREGLAKQLHDTTKIIVAQRISTIRHADKIIVLDRGEAGRHGHPRGTDAELRSLPRDRHCPSSARLSWRKGGGNCYMMRNMHGRPNEKGDIRDRSAPDDGIPPFQHRA